MKKFILGVDISKEKLDLCLLCGVEPLAEQVIANTCEAIPCLLDSLAQKYGFSLCDLLVCGEYTGSYVYPLCCACEKSGVALWLENPRQIKYCSGVHRGKSDKMDARRIALYAYRYQDQVRLFHLPSASLESLKSLVAERDLYMSDLAKYTGLLSDQKDFMAQRDYQSKSQRLKQVISQLKEVIKEIEKKMDHLIESDTELKRQYELLCSVEGVGPRTAIKMIVVTKGFTAFTSARKFCAHAGVAPFSYTSGTSIRSRPKVSNTADKTIKALLHMAALSAATRHKGELQQYYNRKIQQGKNKMSVLNAIRAKIVLRMFAVIKNNTKYKKEYQFALA